MSKSRVNTIDSVHALSFIGPAAVLLSILLLVIKDSPFYIDLSVVALTGLFLSMRWKIKGFIAASSLLSLVLAYDYFIEMDKIGVWELGLGASIELSFLITALASLELFDFFQKAGSSLALEINALETKFKEISESYTSTSSAKQKMEEQLKSAYDLVKSRSETSEMFERLLKIAREELNAQTRLKERFEVELIDAKRQINLLAEQVEGIPRLDACIARINQELANKNVQLLEADGKLQTLGDEFEKLLEKLKDLAEEKEKLQKALDTALQPVAHDPSIEERRLNGLYQQLRLQFVEKSNLLNLTRKELFTMQEQYASSLIANQEQWQINELELLTSFQKTLDKAEEQIKALEQENIQLEAIISTIS